MKRIRKDLRRHRSLKRHGVSSEWFEENRQKGCALCGRPFTGVPHIDHDHRHCTGDYGCKDCVRGLLCRVCNSHFLYAIEMNPALRNLVSREVLEYLDKTLKTEVVSSLTT